MARKNCFKAYDTTKAQTLTHSQGAFFLGGQFVVNEI